MIKKRNSMQKKLIIQFIFTVILVAVFSTIGFYIFSYSEISHFFEMNDNNEEITKQLFTVIKKAIGIIVVNTILISSIIIRILTKTLASPLNKSIEAIKKVADGDFDVRLETTRNDEIKDLVDNFNIMAKQLGKNELLQKDFIDNVSHEIKTPINSIQGFTKLLDDNTLTEEERKEYINIILEETERLLNLSNNILKLAKLQHQEKLTNVEEVNVYEQIKKAITVLEPKWKCKNINFSISANDSYFYGDEDLLFQVWINLLDNAIKFSKENGKIEVKIEENEKSIKIGIKDNGIGMTEEEIENIYSRFYQVDKSHSGEGSGLGLSIVKRIIELSKGSINVKSIKNTGTEFLIELPKKEKENKIII